VSAWRSPLLFFGILLILAAGALGFGPFFINWNSYKAEFQRQASLITGRRVVIDGPLNVRLFPWPRMTAGNVHISNPAGAMLADLASIEMVEAEIAAAPLLSGQISLRKVRLIKPVFSLERMAAGGVNWKLNPVTSVAGLPEADQIAVAGIEIVDGKLFFGDGRRGGLSELTGLEGRLKAPTLEGPWRADLSAEQSGTPLSLTVSTSKYRKGEPLKVSAAITPSGDNGFLWAFDGETLRDDGKVTGRINIQPARQTTGKANPLNAQWQVKLSGDVVADFDAIKLSKIEVVPANDLSGANLLTGSADITLGRQFIVSTNIDAAQIDLDKLFGTNMFEEFGDGQQLKSLSEFLTSLPSSTEISFNTAITSLIAGGETLSRVKLSGQMTPDLMRIAEASANMPGQTKASFSGVLLPAGPDGLPQLAGEVDANSGSLREFVSWVAPNSSTEIQKVWAGARGRAKISAQLGWTPDTFRMSGIKAELDEARSTGSFRISRGDDPSLNIRLVADTINVDRYAPRGFSTSAIEDGTVAGLTELAATAVAFGDTHITLQTDSLLMRGVEARDIAIDIDVSGGAVELRTIEIGGIGDARLDIAGVLNFPDEGITGSISGHFKATDPRPFLRLAGVLDAARSATRWASRLGPVDLKVLSEVSTSDDNNKLTLASNGKAAGATIALTSGFDGKFAEWRDGDMQITGSVTGTTSQNLLALAGLQPVTGGEQPATLKLAFAGKPSSALTGTAELDLLAGKFGFDGGLTIDPASQISAAGTTTVKAVDAAPLMAALGLATPDWPDHILRSVDASAESVFSGGTLKLSELKASLPLNAASGTLDLSGSIRSPRIDGKLAVQRLDLGWLAAALLLPANGKPATSDETFDTTRLGWVGNNLEIVSQRTNVIPGLALSASTLSATRKSADALQFSLSGETAPAEPFSLLVQATSKASILRAQGAIQSTLTLADLLQTSDGEEALSGKANLKLNFAGEGRSPGGLVSQLSGKGKLLAPSLSLALFDVANLVDRVGNLESVENLEQLVTSSIRAGPVGIAMKESDISLENGTLRSAAMPVTSSAANGTLRLTTDLTSERARIDASMKPHGEVPTVSMRLSGHPLSLARTYNTTALKSFVSNNVLQKGLEKLEELQREEQRLIEEERKFREEQAAIEAERKRRIIEARQARETARRRKAEELERLKSAADARARAAKAEVEAQQQRLKDLIQQNVPSTIPEDAIIKPQNSGTQIFVPQQPAGAAN
jgi:uncharacterized protein involved in outer membrane biogenesis